MEVLYHDNDELFYFINKYGEFYRRKYWKIKDVETRYKLYAGASHLFRIHFGFFEITPKILKKLVNYIGKQSVLEIGAGLGFISRMLSNEKVNIVGVDKMKRKYAYFYNVKTMDHVSALKKYKTDILLMIYPPNEEWYEENMCIESLEMFKGNKFILVGEDLKNGFVGSHCSEKFYELLKKKWKCVYSETVSEVAHINQEIAFYERK